MTFYWTKTADVGTTNAYVARIGIGLSDIVELTKLSSDSKSKLNTVLHDLSHDLINAEAPALELKEELDGIEKRLQAHSNDSSTVPSSIESSLKLDLSRVFLKYTNNSFKLLTEVIDICLGIGPKHTQFQNVVKDIQKLDPIPQALLDHLMKTEPWYKAVNGLRNLDEHKVINQKTTSKKLFKNYTINTTKKIAFLERPKFGNGTDVHLFLTKSLEYLLPFFELAIVFTLSYCLPDSIRIEEIPEPERDPKYPKRFRPCIV